ncbi:mitochondrial fission ELM1 family protein [Xanthomonas graminis]|uniref:mitochondrial fission ELM1 family protein n=1 Tax=Xanthomonas graminis TaxID=3390026 RepID=UPI00069FFF08|nr:mitochondrial fission ELM1 family protein [Xanthomonas translucens]OAX60615.1 nucleoside-diphosphate sugar epimerase [Xanthomonas translucens pv. graminis]UKE54310.1 mitochondrial fission ELM1 family protein [Xanthomonas translucens pv. graminis]WIH08693.1 mitochondrial fission ELM1 family protein [Xanthomonas translucens pv. graminis]WIH12215.1 mitochondrial fission ELM1 family protein [Xanthomonas translucens pv. graminis]WIH15887.1 mitochondrial fission ELM1 family protein [Xanthomonas t
MKRSGAPWAISDGRAGNARQAEALAAALSAPAVSPAPVLVLQPHMPWRWLAPRRLPGAAQAYGADFAELLRRPPALAIGCGRQAALATRLLRARGSAVVQVLDPRLSPRHWDLVVVPEHDRLRGDNVLTLLGSLHPIDDAWLAAARAAFPRFGALPSPRTALLVGGPAALAPWTTEAAASVFRHLATQLRDTGGSVLASTSRRTPPAVATALRDAFAGVPGVIWCGERDGPNPYAGLLGWAERIVCTPDSVNLLSEACATRVPVTVAMPLTAHGRARDFHAALHARGRLADATDVHGAATHTIAPLRETARIATRIRERLALDASD